MDEITDINLLLDFYGPLLDEKHRQTVEMYFGDDMTLSEIAGELGVSRQAVQQSIAKARGELETFEKKLGLCGRFRAAEEKLAEVKSLTQFVRESAVNSELLDTCDRLEAAANELVEII
ncbi:MAG: DNA-binding protein [Clostridia bacterium]|nr:DNA-binding protein [Clostridia bacterium]